MIMEPMTDCSASMLCGNIFFNNASSICPSPACIYLLPLSLSAGRRAYSSTTFTFSLPVTFVCSLTFTS
jgi:hypothetical protein